MCELLNKIYAPNLFHTLLIVILILIIGLNNIITFAFLKTKHEKTNSNYEQI